MGMWDKVTEAAKDATTQAMESAEVMVNAPAEVAPSVTPAGTHTVAPEYVVLQVSLKEKLIGTGSGNLSQLENAINTQARQGYRLHTIATSSANSTGFMGGDRIQATLVFEKL